MFAVPSKTPSPDTARPRRKWPWWKRGLAALGALLLILALLYQPILSALIPFAAAKFAAGQHLKVSLRLGGTYFTGLRVEDLDVEPTAPGPIEKCRVGLIELHYSLPMLIRHGLSSAFIEDVTLYDADVIYDPSLSPPAAPKKKQPFSLPPLPLPARLSLRNINFLMRGASPETAKAAGKSAAASAAVPAPMSPAVAGATAGAVSQGLLISGLTLELESGRAGELRWDELRIPGGPDLRKIQAATSYRDRDLQISGLNLAPEIRFRALTLDASKLDQQLLGISFDGDFFGGQADATVQLSGLGTPPKASVQVHASGISLGAVHDFLKLDAPLSGTVQSVAIAFDGNSNEPNTWTGRVDAQLAQPAYGPAALDSVAVRITMHDGAMHLEQAEVVQGANHVALLAQADLPPAMADLLKTAARGTVQIALPDFAKLPVQLPQPLAGAFQAGGDFELADGKLTAHLKGHASNVSAPQEKAQIAGLDFGVTLSGALPTGAAPFYQGLHAQVSASVDQIAYGDYRVDNVRAALSADEAVVSLTSLELARGDNRVSATGTFQLPANFADWRQQPLDLNLNVAAPKLSDFSATPDGTKPLLEGQLQTQGKVSSRGGVLSGDLTLGAQNVRGSGARVDLADVQIGIAQNVATVRSGTIRLDDRNTIELSGHAALQPPYDFDGGFAVDLADLSKFEPLLQMPITGAVHATAHGAGHLATKPGAADQQITGTVDLTAKDVQAKGARIVSVDAHIDIANNQAVIQTGKIQLEGKSGATFSGHADLSPPYAYQGALAADLPDLAAFEPVLIANHIAGHLAGAVHLDAQAQGHGSSLDGKLDLTASKVEAKGVRIESVDGHIIAANGVAYSPGFRIKFNDKNTIDLAADATIAAPFDYHANLNVQLLDLSAFEPALRAAQAAPTASAKISAEVHGTKAVVVNPKPGQTPAPAPAPPPAEPKLAGSVQVQWQAQGAFPKEGAQFSGGLKALVHQVIFNAAGPIEANLAGQYTEKEIDFPILTANSNGFDFKSTFGLKDALARIDNIHLKDGNTELLAGYAQIPLDLTKLSAPDGPVPDVDAIDINIASKPLPLETLLAGTDKSKPAPAQGTVELSALAHGSLSKILAEVKVQGRKLLRPGMTGVSPADADVDLTLRDSRLSLDSSVHQPQIQPLTIKGNLPLDLKTLLSKRQIDPKSPLDLAINLPSSSLAFIAKALPAVRFIEGTAATDIRVGGDIAQPTLSGTVDVNVPAVRAANITVPSVRDLKLRLSLGGRQLRFEQFGAEIGGGKFSLDGYVDLSKLAAPVLQLAIKADNVLALRDDSVTVRVNADIHVTGPVAAATVAGKIGITKSRYLKDIDIIPLNLPGKPAPAPPSPAEAEPTISITAAPISNWKFDLALKTDDPFFVRGNLARGQAEVDLRLRGTGLQPLLDGYVTVTDLTATLPFSRLEISDGNISFTPDQPLNPVLNLTGTSTVENYLVTLYISGRADNPNIVFSSEPPLPQEQIVALLATGSTTQDLAGNSQALAGKAALLVLEDAYRRVFKKKASSDSGSGESFADRVSLDLGNVDPQTGKQQAGARFKISDTVQFLLDFGVEGDLQGRVKYLLRFH